ncbi:MAG: AMP-binding protein, partial [Verrucomicrobiota bacterium]
MQTRFPFQTVAAEQFVPRTHHWSLPAEQCVALRQMGCACGGDPPLVLLGAWAVLAGRLLDATEITIGMRPSPPDGSGPGSGSNAHWPEPRPYHIRWQQSEIFLDFLKRLAGQIAADRKESAPDSNGSVAFSDGLPLAIQFEANTPWLALNREDAEGRSTKTIELFLIKLCCCSQAHSVDFTLHYNSAAMRLGDVERLAEQFYTLIESVLTQPQTPVGRLNLLSAAERRQILLQFNDTARPLPRDQIVLDWIAEQVERRPEAPAVVCGPARLSYGEMNARANALAKQLRAAGVSAGTPVALFLDRSPEMIVAILGALKSGGAYVPIDPAYPKERIEFLLRDSEAPVVVTTRSIWKPMANPAVIIYLDDSNTASLAPEDAGAPMPAPAARSFSGEALVSNSKAQNENEAATDAQQLAYLIYTSGSTGSPKGVMVTHRNLLASTFARRVFYREPVR